MTSHPVVEKRRPRRHRCAWCGKPTAYVTAGNPRRRARRDHDLCFERAAKR